MTVATGTSEYSGTNNYIFVTLVGEEGESERTLLDNPGLDFCRGAVCLWIDSFPLPLFVCVVCNILRNILGNNVSCVLFYTVTTGQILL